MDTREKVRAHELSITKVMTDDIRDDLLTRFFDPTGNHKLMKLLPLGVPVTRRGWAISVTLEVICSLMATGSTASNQIVTVDERVAAGWVAAGSRTQVSEFRK